METDNINVSLGEFASSGYPFNALDGEGGVTRSDNADVIIRWQLREFLDQFKVSHTFLVLFGV